MNELNTDKTAIEQLINDFKIKMPGDKPYIKKSLESTELKYSGGVIDMFDRQLDAILYLHDTNLLSLENAGTLIASLTQDVRNLLIDMNLRPYRGRRETVAMVMSTEKAKRLDMIKPILDELEKKIENSYEPESEELSSWFRLTLKAKLILNGEEVPSGW